MEETGLKKEEEKRGTKQMKNAVKEAWVWNQRWEKDIFLFLTMPSGMLDLVSRPGIKALPLQCKCTVLTAGPPGSSQRREEETDNEGKGEE